MINDADQIGFYTTNTCSRAGLCTRLVYTIVQSNVSIHERRQQDQYNEDHPIFKSIKERYSNAHARMHPHEEDEDLNQNKTCSCQLDGGHLLPSSTYPTHQSNHIFPLSSWIWYYICKLRLPAKTWSFSLKYINQSINGYAFDSIKPWLLNQSVLSC